MAESGRDFKDVDLGEQGKGRQWFQIVLFVCAVAVFLLARTVDAFKIGQAEIRGEKVDVCRCLP